MEKKKRKSKACNCLFFRSTGNVFGGCKHPKYRRACIETYLDDCQEGVSRFRKEIVSNPKPISNYEDSRGRKRNSNRISIR